VLRRGLQWLRAEAPFVVVVALVVAAGLYLHHAPGHWRRVSGIIAAALLLAGVLRLVLPPGQIGLLNVRGRMRDTVTYLLIGGLILGVAIHLH
jgi:Protein of unknown function (DUF3017)